MDFLSNITLFIFIGLILLGRYINAQAIKKLSVEKKAELLDTFSTFGIFSIIPLLVIIGLTYWIADNFNNHSFTYLYLAAILIILYIIGIQIYIYRKLIKLNYPISYIRHYILSVCIRFLAVGVLILPMFIK